MAIQRIIITNGDVAGQFSSKVRLSGDKRDSAVNISNFVKASAGGLSSASYQVNVDSAQAVGTITSTGTATNNETLTVCGVTLTAKTSGATGPQFNISATVATQAANIAAAINATATISTYCSATSSLGVVTITITCPGVLGNLATITESCTNVSAVSFTGGTDGTSYSLDLL
jgi:hypothetical protein